MKDNFFRPADILLPNNIEYRKWSVIACDQFTSDPSYWKRVKDFVGVSPSTLHLIVPEAFLDTIDMSSASAECERKMRDYLDGDLFSLLPNSFVYVERETSSGIRRGLVGMLDLDAYDFSGENALPIRSTEATVVSRLPARIAVRKLAPIELPHVMTLINDPEMSIIEPLARKVSELCKLYDFELMEGGGHICGYRVTGKDAENIQHTLASSTKSDVKIVVGDGNHSLAAAKRFWESIKFSLTESEKELHPARFALVELNNVYDSAISIEPIHRTIFGVNSQKFISELSELSDDRGYSITCVSCGNETKFCIPAESYGALIEKVQNRIDSFISENGGRVDYIHDELSARALSNAQDKTAVILPALPKSDIFKTVELGKTFPRKSFSIGQARDKRYYLECRRIK